MKNQGPRNEIILGDALTLMKTWPNKFINCVVTSPPYWNLRDYGVPGQLGLEKTPEEYIEKLVAIFREVKRILRDDGTCFLNLGMTYASGGINPNQSPLLWRVPACDSNDKEFPDSQDHDHVYPCSCDELQDGTENHHVCTFHSAQCVSQVEPPTLPKDHDSEHLDYGKEPLDVSSPVSQESTIEQSSFQPLGAFDPEAMVSVSRQANSTFSDDAQASEDTKACKSDISQKLQPLVIRTKGKESFFSACQSPDCNGIGRCGLCWCRLAIGTLNVKAKDEVNIPHLVAMALQADGWVLRQTLVWSKPNPMPSNVKDRCTSSHEYIFLLSKKKKYYFDYEAIQEPCVESNAARPRMGQGKNTKYKQKREAMKVPAGWDMKPGGHGSIHREGRTNSKYAQHMPKSNAGVMHKALIKARSEGNPHDLPFGEKRNKRSVWTVPTHAFPDAHFATFPPDLIEPCILAGCPKGGIVFDPFSGTATTAAVSIRNGRDYLGTELNPDSIEMGKVTIAEAISGVSRKELKSGQLPLIME